MNFIFYLWDKNVFFPPLKFCLDEHSWWTDEICVQNPWMLWINTLIYVNRLAAGGLNRGQTME